MSIIIYGPQGCGKTRHAEILRKHYNMAEVVDDGSDPYPMSPKQQAEFKNGKVLFLTDVNAEIRGYSTHNRRVISYQEAMKEVKNER